MDLRLGHLQPGLRRAIGRAGVVPVGLGNQILLVERFCAIKVQLSLRQVRPGLRETAFAIGHIGFHLHHLDLKRRRIDHRDKLPGLHLRIEISIQVPDDAGDLTAHLHRLNGIDRARRRDDLGHRPALNFRRLVLKRRFLVAIPIPDPSGPENNGQERRPGDPFASVHEPPCMGIDTPMARSSWALAAW